MQLCGKLQAFANDFAISVGQGRVGLFCTLKTRHRVCIVGKDVQIKHPCWRHLWAAQSARGKPALVHCWMSHVSWSVSAECFKHIRKQMNS